MNEINFSCPFQAGLADKITLAFQNCTQEDQILIKTQSHLLLEARMGRQENPVEFANQYIQHVAVIAQVMFKLI